jgi:hypothetical protein
MVGVKTGTGPFRSKRFAPALKRETRPTARPHGAVRCGAALAASFTRRVPPTPSNITWSQGYHCNILSQYRIASSHKGGEGESITKTSPASTAAVEH